MTRLLFATAFLLGAAAVVWMGSNFLATDTLGLTVIAVIGGVYAIGVVELMKFRHATSTLSGSLLSLSGKNPPQITVLDEWLIKLHPSLQNSVRLRIEGERVGLPAPVMTPYFVGLLVMLGLLGTFVGMVDTLKGAVIALEGSTKLEAIRAGLTAPIAGLSLAFGTSVAGVSASAMLGLMSTLSRRDRLIATRFLDSKSTGVFREFSLVHSRQQTYKALQAQSQGLPEITEKLNVLIDQMGRMSESLGNTLITNQDHFHASVKTIYTDLASSLGGSLRESMAQSGRLTGESIKPLLAETMTSINTHINQAAKDTHQQLTETVQQQLESVSIKLMHTSGEIGAAIEQGILAHDRSNELLVNGMSASFAAFNEQFSHSAGSVLDSVNTTTSGWAERQELADKTRFAHWTDSLEQSQQQAAERFTEASTAITGELKRVAEMQQLSFSQVSADFEATSLALTELWSRSGKEAVSSQQAIVETLESTARTMADNARTSSTQMLKEMSDMLASSEHLIHKRIETEQSWLDAHEQRMQSLTSVVATQLTGIREDEARRGLESINRLAELEATVSTHLATLGKALEEPMTRLIHTASETPRAAAEVIGQLRGEISKSIERDNDMLEERSRIMKELNSLSTSLEQASSGQLIAVEKLVDASTQMLKEIGSEFSHHVESEVSKMSEVADYFSGSATEMSCLGEAFGVAVSLFNESNGRLIENLNRIENALEKSTSRSDDQLGYYIAQAREVIDHSLLSQKEIFEELRHLDLGRTTTTKSVAKNLAEVS